MNQNRTTWPKASWRSHLNSVPPGNSALVVEQAYEFLQSESGVWAGFQALKNEIDCSEVYLKTREKIQWVFPFLRDPTQKLMEFRQGFQFEKSSLGFLQPLASSKQIAVADIKGILVPGLGFDRKGMRIGRGQGYYDRALENFKGLKIGICFESHIADSLPADEFDVQMDAIVSEKGAMWFR